MLYRTVWMSDLHLGTRGSNAAGVLDFFKHNEFERLYLVGDVIDIWRLRKERYWPQTHNDVIQKILRKARKGTQIIVIPGNHDEFCLNFLGVYGNIVVKERDVYTTADGEWLLVLHGHEFDSVTIHAKWMAYLGDAGYTMLLRLNHPLNLVRRLLGLGFWSLSAYVKQNVKKVVSSISRFEEAVAHYAELHDVGGIVYGHIHTPAARQIRWVNYYNAGDWVENSTALVEHLDGRLELVYWREQGAEEMAAVDATPSDLADKSALLAATR